MKFVNPMFQDGVSQHGGLKTTGACRGESLLNLAQLMADALIPVKACAASTYDADDRAHTPDASIRGWCPTVS